MPHFWDKVKKPVFILAPMEEVTDVVFREMFALYGKPDILFTEFVSTDGLMHPEGRKRLMIDLKYTEIQRPIIAQIWGADPEKFLKISELIAELGFDGIDINMGCPQSKEISIGACAALIKTPKLAQEIIYATQKGAGSLPVSVKTRLGYSKVEEMETWVKTLLETKIAALTLHGRTKKEMSKVPAHWDKIAEAVKIRDNEKSSTLIIGNGDIKSYQDGIERIAQTGVDGIMVGRGCFGNPWFFSNKELPSIRQRLGVMVEHAKKFEETFTGIKSFAIMRKHFKAYALGFPGASELRMKLMETKDAKETEKVVNDFLAI